MIMDILPIIFLIYLTFVLRNVVKSNFIKKLIAMVIAGLILYKGIIFYLIIRKWPISLWSILGRNLYSGQGFLISTLLFYSMLNLAILVAIYYCLFYILNSILCNKPLIKKVEKVDEFSDIKAVICMIEEYLNDYAENPLFDYYRKANLLKKGQYEVNIQICDEIDGFIRIDAYKRLTNGYAYLIHIIYNVSKLSLDENSFFCLGKYYDEKYTITCHKKNNIFSYRIQMSDHIEIEKLRNLLEMAALVCIRAIGIDKLILSRQDYIEMLDRIDKCTIVKDKAGKIRYISQVVTDKNNGNGHVE